LHPVDAAGRLGCVDAAVRFRSRRPDRRHAFVDWPADVLARRRVAGVLGRTETAVRVRRPDAPDRALSERDAGGRGADAVPDDARRTGVVRVATERRRPPERPRPYVAAW